MSWDWKSIRNAIILILILLIVFWRIGFGATNDYKKELKKLDRQAKGTITNVEILDYLSEGRTGNKNRVLGYKVTFKYKIGTQDYSNTILIKEDQKQYNLVKQKYFGQGEKTVDIKYQGYNPQKSLIDF
jgi:hypothetical protein